MKVWNYCVIMVGLVFLFQMAGIDLGLNGFEDLLGMASGKVPITASAIWNALFGSVGAGILTVSVTISIVAGFFARAQLENLIILPFITGTLVLFAQVASAIMNYSLAGDSNLDKFVASLLTLIFAPLLVGFIISLVEFFRGTD